MHLLVPGDLIGRKGKGQKRPHAQGNRQEANLRPRTDPSAPPKKQKSKACRTPEKDKAVRVEPGARLCPKACKAHRIGVKIHGQQPRLPQAFPGHGNRRISGAPSHRDPGSADHTAVAIFLKNRVAIAQLPILIVHADFHQRIHQALVLIGIYEFPHIRPVQRDMQIAAVPGQDQRSVPLLKPLCNNLIKRDRMVRGPAFRRSADGRKAQADFEYQACQKRQNHSRNPSRGSRRPYRACHAPLDTGRPLHALTPLHPFHSPSSLTKSLCCAYPSMPESACHCPPA